MTLYRGIPTEETAAAIYNHLDYIRGVESFLNGMPAASLEAIRRGQASLGVKNYNQVLIFDQLMDSNPLFLTGKGWFCVLRLYSPTEAWFDKTWRPGEIELVK